jgi:enoyl-CoA hydratase/carnithine racemase
VSWSLSVDNSIAVVSYANPPENRVPFSALRDLDALLEQVGRDSDVKLVLLRSGVGGVFSAGAALPDIKALASGEAPSAPFDWWMRALLRLEELPQPTVAFVDGLAASGGAELALACTMRVGTARAEFVLREIARGAIPGAGATQRLPRIVGTARAAEIILTARSVGADEALALGLLQSILPQDGAQDHLDAWLARFAAMPRAGLVAAKRAIVDGARLPLTEGLRLEQSLFRDLVAQR